MFSVQLAQLNNIDTSSNGLTWYVTATINVQFEGSKRSVLSQDIGLHSSVTVTSNQGKTSMGTSLSTNSAVIATLIMLLVVE